jgi:uncharacterized protein (TIGR03083 family)
MMNPTAAIEHLGTCWDSLDELFGGFSAELWAVPSLCPGWSVRDVMIHLGAVEHMLVGEPPGSMTESLPFHKVADWIDSVAELDDAAVFERYRHTIAARRIELAAVTEEQLALPSATPVGPGTYGRFMAVRVFDFWVHEQDIRTPLGLPGHERGAAAEMAIDEIHRSLPYIVGKKIGLPDGSSITIEIDGGVRRTMHVAVTGRAALVDSLEAPDVVVRADSTTFALLACGRIDPQGAIDDGRISWSGDATWGEAAARNLAFTM